MNKKLEIEFGTAAYEKQGGVIAETLFYDFVDMLKPIAVPQEDVVRELGIERYEYGKTYAGHFLRTWQPHERLARQ